jgi:uncharacterized membrane protein
MLVPIPIGLWIFSLVCDAVYHAGRGGDAWKTVALYTMAGGIVGAVAAAVPGVIDMLSLRGSPKKVALIHMALNIVVVLLYAGNFGWRYGAGPDDTGPVWLSALSVVLLGVSGWLGGKMVYEQGVAVHPAPPVDVQMDAVRRPSAGSGAGPRPASSYS